MHLHIGFLDFGKFLCYLIIAGFLLRVLALKFHDTKFGQALHFIY